MKKVFLVLTSLVITIIIAKVVFFGNINPTNSNKEINDTYNSKNDGMSLENIVLDGFYIKKDNKFYKIHNDGKWNAFMEYLIVPNSCYYEDLEMNEGDEIIYINDDKKISDVTIWYFEDLNFSTIGVPLRRNDNNESLYFGDTIGSAKTSLSGYREILKIDNVPIKTRISHEYFIDNLSEDSEYILSCLKGTKTEEIKVKADCHILKNINNFFSRNYIAKTNWILSDQGYVTLNKNFSNSYDMSTFSKDGFYLLEASITGYNSNVVTSVLIKYKK